MMSALMICPAKVVVPPWPLLAPAALAVVVSVTASVCESLVKSASLQTKQIRLMFDGEALSELTAESAPRAAWSAAFGAASQVANEAVITSVTELVPVMLLPIVGFRFHCTGKALKSQWSIWG